MSSSQCCNPCADPPKSGIVRLEHRVEQRLRAIGRTGVAEPMAEGFAGSPIGEAVAPDREHERRPLQRVSGQ
jgi:hypothetical protein